MAGSDVLEQAAFEPPVRDRLNGGNELTNVALGLFDAPPFGGVVPDP
jgi:hypothetical protein